MRVGQLETVGSSPGPSPCRTHKARHRRFAAALNAARGAFRSDKSVEAELDLFKRSATKAKKAKG